ncbi:MAG: Bax inhibitor-1/YccA family protein [Acetobacter sp.]|nr:Bax inhibitor-1/YccA family protein [Acetobacter sp.]
MSFNQNYRSPATVEWGEHAQQIDVGLRNYMLRVYNWMASGLLLTCIIAYVIANTSLSNVFFKTVITPAGIVPQPTMLGNLAILSPLAFVLVLSFGVNKLSLQSAQALFWTFCVSMGASMASIFVAYTGTSIVRVFLITSCMFAAMSLYGYVTKANLLRFGSFLMMGLIGLIIAMVVNLFLQSATVYYIYSIIGVGLFTVFTAFDSQRIRITYTQLSAYAGQELLAKNSIYDALSLYLNFINLFQFLIQFIGVRSSGD